MSSTSAAREYADYLNGTEFALMVSYDKRISCIVANVCIVVGGREAGDEVEEV
jgi:hypothetical protein